MFLDNTLRLTYNSGLFSSSLLSIFSVSSGFCTAVEPIDSFDFPYLIGQSFHQPDDPSARIICLSPKDQDHPGFSAVLAKLTSMAAASGAFQILAEVDQNSLEETLLMRAGFRPYANQQIWKILFKSSRDKSENNWLPITPADIEQVLSLYNRIVPAQVQRVELPPSRSFVQGLLCRKQGKVTGAAFTQFGPRGILADLIIDPDLEDMDSCLKAFYSNLPYRNSRDVYLRVRSYQQRLASVLEKDGASCGPEQNAVVKRLAVHYNAKKTFRVQRFENQPDITTPISNSKIENLNYVKPENH
jgi:hypothetical protein